MFSVPDAPAPSIRWLNDSEGSADEAGLHPGLSIDDRRFGRLRFRSTWPDLSGLVSKRQTPACNDRQGHGCA